MRTTIPPADGVGGGRRLAAGVRRGPIGHVDVTVGASDLAGLFVQTVVRMTVTPVNTGNSPPTVASPLEPLTLEAGAADLETDLAAVFADADVAAGTDSLRYSISNTNAGLLNATLSGSLLTVSLIPGQLGTAEITLRATDNADEYAETSFLRDGGPLQRTADGHPASVRDGRRRRRRRGAEPVGLLQRRRRRGRDLVFDVALAPGSEADPASAAVDSATGAMTLLFLPNANGAAQYTVNARDTGGKIATATLSLTVNPVNDPPTGPATLRRLRCNARAK